MRIKSKEAAAAEVDMTPMIDIVFQLIAFFMVITNFEQTLADERVKLPKDELAKPSEMTRDTELVLNVGFLRDSQGQNLSEPLVFYQGTGEQVPVLQMGPVLQRERRLFQDTGVSPRDVTIILRADSEVPTGLVQELIKLSQEAEFERFALKAMQSIE